MRVKHFDWDSQNVEHILAHDVLPEEVEEVFDRKPQIRKGRQKTYIAYGLTDFGRPLMVVFKYSSGETARINHSQRHDNEGKEILQIRWQIK